MKKWALAAILYLLIVVGGYTVYANVFEKERVPKTMEMSEHGHEEDKGAHDGSNEVTTQFTYENGEININLTDPSNKPVNNLLVKHEKLLHLIIVDEQLNQYYHLHPQKNGEGKFTLKKVLQEGNYKAFIDIKPKELSYSVDPIPFKVGNPKEHQHAHILPDQTLTKTVDGETVTLNMTSMKPKESVTLTFDLNKTQLEPYLGAMGHIVILDEQANQYLHVHPKNEKEPIFETQFAQEGIYKIWAEFKQNGKVRVFPFVVEIKK